MGSPQYKEPMSMNYMGNIGGGRSSSGVGVKG